MFADFSLSGKPTRRRHIQMNLSHAADVTTAGVNQKASATNCANTVVQKQHSDKHEAVTRRGVRQVNVNHQSTETSVETFNAKTLTEGDHERSVSDSACLLGKSSASKVIVVKRSDSVQVVNQSTAAASAACFVVLKPLSSFSGQRVVRNITPADGRDEKVGGTSRGSRKRRCQVADSDVEPDDAGLTSNSTASCKYC